MNACTGILGSNLLANDPIKIKFKIWTPNRETQIIANKSRSALKIVTNF